MGSHHPFILSVRRNAPEVEGSVGLLRPESKGQDERGEKPLVLSVVEGSLSKGITEYIQE